MDKPPKHKWLTNPLAGLDSIPKPEYDDVWEHENRWGEEVKDLAIQGLAAVATQGRFTDPPASQQTVNVAATEVMDLHPNIYRQAVVYHRNNPDAGWGAAIQSAKLSAGSSPENLHRRFMKGPKDRFPDADIAGGIRGMAQEPKVSTNEKLKQALIANDVIRLAPAFKGGKPEFRMEADYFDVSAALIGGGAEDAVDASGNRVEYDRDKVTKFGGTKKEKRDLVYNHIKNNLKRRKKDGTGTDITREEFNQYAKEQIAAEKDLRNAIRLLNIRNYASMKGIDLSEYPTAESQLKLLANINKAKHTPRRKKDKKTGEFTEGLETFEARTEIWKLETAPFQQYTDYKETFDYGHIISAKTGFRVGDLGMNRITNTEIEPARNIESFDPYTKKIIEILQEGNRERGSRREHILAIQRMRGTSSSVVEDYVKWKDMKDDNPVRLDKILEKFIPAEQEENFLKFMQDRFYEKRKMSGSLKQFMQNDLGIPYKEFKNFGNDLKLRIRRAYEGDIVEWGNVIGQQQYDLGEKWMRDSIDEFINLHPRSKPRQIKVKDKAQLEDIENDFVDPTTGAPLTIEDLMDMILPD